MHRFTIKKKHGTISLMTKTSALGKKKCVPCHMGLQPLEKKEVDKLLKDLSNEWQTDHLGHLYKVYPFHDFVDAMNFAHEITKIAEQENHHPDLKISYGQCIVEIWTHKINGLSESDFILAAKIDDIIHEQ